MTLSHRRKRRFQWLERLRVHGEGEAELSPATKPARNLYPETRLPRRSQGLGFFVFRMVNSDAPAPRTKMRWYLKNYDPYYVIQFTQT
jgi:hypothetical protein